MKIFGNRGIPGVVALAAFLLVVLVPQAHAAEERQSYTVVLKDSVEHTPALARQQAEARNAPLSYIYDAVINGYAAKLTPAQVAGLEESPKVKYVEKNKPAKLFAQTVPTGINRIFAPQNPAADIDGADDVRVDVDVAVIDSGVDFNHEDLNVYARTKPAATYAWVNCSNANVEDELPENDACTEEAGTDDNGHGTHVAGTVGAIDNGVGVAGVAPGARIWSARLIPDSGTTFNPAAATAAFDWVYAHRSEIEVVNMSFGGDGERQTWREAISKTVDAGVVFVAAAGNDGSDASSVSPAMFSDVITVSALADYDGVTGSLSAQNCELSFKRGADDTLALYSNWGSVVDIAAPGTCIYSTFPVAGSFFGKNYGPLSGTSMATPHVSGAAALFASASNPNTRADVEAMRQKLIDEGSQNWIDVSGDGQQEPLLDLRPAGTAAETTPGSSPQRGTVKLNGIVNPGGAATTYQLEYGLTTSYGTSVPATAKSAGSAIKDVLVSESVNVPVETTYHYRLMAKSSQGTFYGTDQVVSSSKWSVQKSESPPPGSSNTELRGVSCISGTECIAVGAEGKKAFAERLSGGQWLTAAPALPEGSTESPLKDVSCVSETFCIAVGKHLTGGGNPKPLIERWDGSKWSILTAPMPTPSEAGVAQNGVLQGVSCTSSSACIAVGQYVNTQPKFSQPTEEKTLVESWDGSKWTVVSSPNAAGLKFNHLRSVSCSSSANCIAVGAAGPNRPENEEFWASSSLLAQRWNGTGWSLQTVPDVSTSTRDTFNDVSCSSATACMAVGSAFEKSKGDGFTMQWSEDAWKLSSSELEKPLYSVACAATRSCDAIGVTLGRHWNGSYWVAEELAKYPADDFGSEELQEGTGLGIVAELRGLACPQERCIAVGHHHSYRNPVNVPLAERLSPPPAGFANEKTPAHIQASPTSQFLLTTTGFGSIKCSEGPNLTASVSKKYPETIEATTVGKANCSGGFSSLDMNGCKPLFHPAAEETAAGVFKGTFDIGPAGCGPVRLIAAACEVKIEPEIGLAATYRNQGSGSTSWVAAEAQATGLDYTSTNGGCGSSGTNGTLSGTWPVKAYANEAHTSQQGVSVVPTRPAGLFLSGKESAEEAARPKLEAEAYAASIAASQSTQFKFTAENGGTLKCSGSPLLLHTASGSSADLSFEATHSGCSAFAQTTAVAMNSCRFVLHVANAGPPYVGSEELACANGGDAVKVSVGSPTVSCTLTIAPQSLGSVAYQNLGSGSARTVTAAVSGTGITYTSSGGACGSAGTHKGTYSGTATLQGTSGTFE